MKKIIRILVGIFTLIAAGWIAWSGVAMYREQCDQQDGPICQALVTDAQKRLESSGSRHNRSHHTVFDITYTYTADGQNYTGKIIGSTRKYGIDSRMQIKYDPQDPSVSTHILKPDFFDTVGWNLIGACVFAGIGLFLLGARPPRRKTAGRKIAFAVKVTAVMICICLVVGIFMLAAGIRTIGDGNTAKGTLCDLVTYVDADGITLYRGVYAYTVKEEQYTVMTDYGMADKPSPFAEAEICYDPQDPAKADIVEPRRILLYGGLMFTGVPIVFIVGWLVFTGKLRFRKIDMMDLLVGLVTGSISLGMCYALTGKFSVIAAFGKIGLLALIPALMLLAAIWVIIRGLFLQGKKTECD